jgi:hypothetical protein
MTDATYKKHDITPEAEAELLKVTALQFTFKPGPMTMTMCEIVLQLTVAPNMRLWGDEFSFQAGDDDRNCIGTAFRMLMKANVIERLTEFRRSEVKVQKGRVVWHYAINDYRLAKAFLKRYGIASTGQEEFRFS